MPPPQHPEPAAPRFDACDLPRDGRDYADVVELQTRRMRLRRFGFRHTLDLLQLGREERVTRTLLDDPVATLDDAMGLVVWANTLYRTRPGLGLWHAGDRNGRFLGLFSLTPSGGADDVADMAERLNEFGSASTYGLYPAGWALTMNTPYQWTKQVASHHGGNRDGAIVRWPARIRDGGTVRHQWHHVIDVMPTLLEAAGVAPPTTMLQVVRLAVPGQVVELEGTAVD